MLKLSYLVGILALACATAQAAEHELSGTWKFEKAADYRGNSKALAAPELTTVQIINGALLMRPKCTDPIDYEKAPVSPTLFPDQLRPLIDKFLQNELSFDLVGTKHFYKKTEFASNCDAFFQDMLVSKDRLIVVRGGTTFFSYAKVVTPPGAAVDPAVNLFGRKLSQLPFHPVVFRNMCAAQFPPLASATAARLGEKCTPVYHPYVATKNDTDALGKLIGAHQYNKNGAKGSKDYDNPVARKLRPVYLLLPPMKDVLVVPVVDTEEGERHNNRSGIFDLYLVIKNGSVTDQLNQECTLNEQYSCVTAAGDQYQLLETGKFKKVK